MTSLKHRMKTYIKAARQTVKRPTFPRQSLHKNVPYFSQWESPELNQSILEHTIDTQSDPNWKKSGASSKEEYAMWSWNACGMACTKMILAHQTGEVIPIVPLAKKCAEYGGYTFPLETSNGLVYKPYSQFMTKEFHIKAVPVAPLLLKEMCMYLSQGSYVIASVNAMIRDPRSVPPNKGGHLILMLGYDVDKQQVYFHNPSGTKRDNQAYAAVSFKDFKKFFSGRGIVLTPMMNAENRL